jgi:hypothetical protein
VFLIRGNGGDLELIAATQVILLAYTMGLILLKKQYDQERPAKQQRPASWVSVTVESIVRSKKTASPQETESWQNGEMTALWQEPDKYPSWRRSPEKDPLWQQEPEKDPSWRRSPENDPLWQQEPEKDPLRQQEPGKDSLWEQEPGKDPLRQQEPEKRPSWLQEKEEGQLTPRL